MKVPLFQANPVNRSAICGLLAASVLLGVVPAHADDALAPERPDLDADAVVNESYNLLKNREPDMTASEMALYERVVPIVFKSPDMAVNLLERMIQDKEVESASFDFALANVYLNAGRTTEAEAHYRQAVEKYPEFLRAWENLGILYYKAEQYPSAVECFCKANTLGAPTSERLGVLAFCLRETGNLAAAESAYMQALTLDPTNADWTDGLISLYLTDESWSKGEAMLKCSLSIRPDNVKNWKLYAWVLDKEGKKTQAMSCLDLADSRGILDGDGLLQLGDLRRDMGFSGEAVDAYRKAALAGQSLGSERLIKMAMSLIDGKDYDGAGKMLSELPDTLSENLTGRKLVVAGRLMLATGQPQQALEELLKAERISPLDGNVQLLMGQAYVDLGDPDRAVAAYETAGRDPDFSRRASLLLANVSLSQNDYDGCARHLRDALAIQDDSQLREYLLQIQACASDKRIEPLISTKEMK